jgi:crossover junction endodeoxyribonuclease RuvC
VTFIGIDPGKNGGIVWLDEYEPPYGMPLPYDGSDLDVRALKKAFTLETANDVVFIETPMIRSAQQGALVIGANYGRILAVLTLLDIPVRQVTPAAWTKKLLPGHKGADKGPHIALCKQLFPSLELVMPGCRKPHDGIADAALIAEYGRRTWK